MLNLLKNSYTDFDEKIFTDKLYSFDIKRQYRYHPSLSFILEKQGMQYNENDVLFINSAGLRAPETYDEDSFRICLIGGSVAFGSYAPKNGSTISSFLEKILKKKNTTNVQVFNCGYGAHLSYQHLISLNNVIIPKYKPHLIICLSGFNDFKASLRNLQRGYPLQDEFSNLIRTIQSGTFMQILKSVYLKTLILRYSFFKKLSIFLFKFRKKDKRHRFVANTNIDEQIQFYADNIIDMMNLSNSKGISFIHYMQPCIGIGKKNLTKFENEVLKGCKKDFPKYVETLTKFYSTSDIKIKKKLKNNNHQTLHIKGINVFDKNQDQIYVDPAHIGDKGNYNIAQNMAKHVNNFYKDKKFNL